MGTLRPRTDTRMPGSCLLLQQHGNGTMYLSFIIDLQSLMTLQNRVDPWGRLRAVSARGSLLGNRGILHDEHKQIVAPWRHKAWVTCKLEYQGVKREIFSSGNYSELFFLDEATALSAGHRPCAECRRDRYNEFKAVWCAANLEGVLPSSVPIAQIDRQLHSERAVRGGDKVTFQTELKNLHPGVFIEANGDAFLLWNDRFYLWSPHGYTASNVMLDPSQAVNVLTPASVVETFRQGFIPQVHESAC
jgi:hypothetical protein